MNREGRLLAPAVFDKSENKSDPEVTAFPGDGGCCGMVRGVRQVYDADGLRLY